jgi:hypothetical protein
MRRLREGVKEGEGASELKMEVGHSYMQVGHGEMLSGIEIHRYSEWGYN